MVVTISAVGVILPVFWKIPSSGHSEGCRLLSTGKCLAALEGRPNGGAVTALEATLAASPSHRTFNGDARWISMVAIKTSLTASYPVVRSKHVATTT